MRTIYKPAIAYSYPEGKGINVGAQCLAKAVAKRDVQPMKKIRKCQVCAQYTMQETHCGMATKTAHPPKYTIADKYARFRRASGAGTMAPLNQDARACLT